MFTNPYLALFVTFLIALLWLRFNNFVAHKKWVSGYLSRKIIHTGTGPLFILCWLLFPNILSSQFLAASVPALITIQFFLVGIGVINDQAAVEAMSRTGDRRELLSGPLYYGVLFTLISCIYWRNSPIGIVALMIMCGGDGIAAILGNRWGSKKLPWNKNKSWIGSIGMFLGGYCLAFLMVIIFSGSVFFQINKISFAFQLMAVTLIATLVESINIENLDNITVPISAIISGLLLF